MEKLRKQIKESFFNPILHFLPLLIFLVVDDFSGIFIAWEISLVSALFLLIYVFFLYNRVFTWHLIFTAIFISSSILAAFDSLLPTLYIDHQILYEVIILTYLIFFVIFRNQIQKIVLRLMSENVPMTNNFNELYRVIWVFIFVLSFYISGFLLVKTLKKNVHEYQQLLQYLYIALLTFLSIYEILRVKIIRSKLLTEEWLPIVNTGGKIIGSIQHQTSLHDKNKYLHPVVRLLFINKSMILLRKISNEEQGIVNLWETTFSDHVKIGQTIEQCIENLVDNESNEGVFKYTYLSKYTLECKNEKQFAFLFVSCLKSEFPLNHKITEQTKWWTTNQIEENLEIGIFTENFKIEYDLLKRSGVLESGMCNCSCKLKEIIYNQPVAVR